MTKNTRKRRNKKNRAMKLRALAITDPTKHQIIKTRLSKHFRNYKEGDK